MKYIKRNIYARKASLKIQETTGAKCVVGLSETKSLKNELSANFNCKSTMKTECYSLSELLQKIPSGRTKAFSPEFKNCRRFFRKSSK